MRATVSAEPHFGVIHPHGAGELGDQHADPGTTAAERDQQGLELARPGHQAATDVAGRMLCRQLGGDQRLVMAGDALAKAERTADPCIQHQRHRARTAGRAEHAQRTAQTAGGQLGITDQAGHLVRDLSGGGLPLVLHRTDPAVPGRLGLQPGGTRMQRRQARTYAFELVTPGVSRRRRLTGQSERRGHPSHQQLMAACRDQAEAHQQQQHAEQLQQQHGGAALEELAPHGRGDPAGGAVVHGWRARREQPVDISDELGVDGEAAPGRQHGRRRTTADQPARAM
jgi:hypothetical protein